LLHHFDDDGAKIKVLAIGCSTCFRFEAAVGVLWTVVYVSSLHFAFAIPVYTPAERTYLLLCDLSRHMYVTLRPDSVHSDFGAL